MTDDDIPLEIRPRKGRARDVSPQETIPVQALDLPKRQEGKRETVIVPEVDETTGDPAQGSARPLVVPSVSMTISCPAEVGSGSDVWTEGAKEPPLILIPARPVRRIEDLPPVAGEPERPAPDDTARSSRPLLGVLLLVVVVALLALWSVQALIDSVSRFATFHPFLAPLAYGLAGILLLLVLLLLYRQWASYRRLDRLDALRGRLERARLLGVSQAEDGQLRGDFRDRVEKDAAARRISSDVRRAVLSILTETTTLGRWVDSASICLLRDRDEQVKQLIEREARLVGVGTALSPSGPLDLAIVLWRNARLVFRIAEIYGVRPGGYGNYRLLRRVVTNMVVAGLSQEAMQMLYAAYGPAAVEAASRGFRSFFDLVSKGGMALATVEPVTGGLLATVGAVGKGTADFAGATAAQVSGPLLQGVLNAMLTLRVGIAAQNECRLVPLSAEDRRTQSAGILSTLVGFFLSVRRTMPRSAPGLGDGSGTQAEGGLVENAAAQ